MHTLTEPLREELRQFSTSIKAIQNAADAVNQEPQPELRAQIDATYAFLVE